jgi:hypothetical protein
MIERRRGVTGVQELQNADDYLGALGIQEPEFLEG